MQKKLTLLSVLLLIGAGCGAADQAPPAAGTQLEGTPYVDDTPPDGMPVDPIPPQPDPYEPTSAAPSGTTAAQAAETGEVKTFTVTGDNFAYDVTEIKVKKGDKVRIVFKNAEGFHDLKIDEFSLATAKLAAGGEETLEFTADKAGTFEYYCSVGKHRQMGMKGNLIVE